MKRLLLLAVVALGIVTVLVVTRESGGTPASAADSAARTASTAAGQSSDASAPTLSPGAESSPASSSTHADEDEAEHAHPQGEELATAVPTPAAAGWDEPTRQAAIGAAQTVVSAYGSAGVDQVTWWAQLEPHLSESAAWVYETVDVRQVPVLNVTGTPVLGVERSALLAEVEVPTDAGPYRVTLTREDGASPWLVERIEPVQ